MKCVESLGKRDFTLDEVYAFSGISGILPATERQAQDTSATSVSARSRIY
jgi:hypothetical protein